MNIFLKKSRCIPFVLLCFIPFFSARASHVVGGELTYKFIDSTGNQYHYRVTLQLYEDCQAGQPEAIAQDNPAFFAVYDAKFPFLLRSADSVNFTSSVEIPYNTNGPCGLIAATGCLLRKTFIKDYYLPKNTSGYIINYQRCCRNNTLSNVSQPGNTGVTYFCTIPPKNVANVNNSAVFKNYPSLLLDINRDFVFDHSATDADGDSLSYELCSAIAGATDANIKPFPPAPPPFNDVSYLPPSSYSNPVPAVVSFRIDPASGMLTGRPDQLGLYLVTVCCNEWRNGVLINTIRREFQLKIALLEAANYKPDAGPDVNIVAGSQYQFGARGAISYSWSPASNLSDPGIPDPLGTFPDPGVYIYTVSGISDSGCTGSDEIKVTVSPFSKYVVPTAFTPNNDGRNDRLVPYPVGQCELHWFKIFNRHGNIIYNANTQYPGWDGTYHSKEQDMGVFYWELEYTDNTGTTRLTKGDVTLVK